MKPLIRPALWTQQCSAVRLPIYLKSDKALKYTALLIQLNAPHWLSMMPQKHGFEACEVGCVWIGQPYETFVLQKSKLFYCVMPDRALQITDKYNRTLLLSC